MKNNFFRIEIIFVICFLLLTSVPLQGQPVSDTAIIFTPSDPNLVRTESYRASVHAWGLDLLFSNNGFGLGGFYRYEVNNDFSLLFNLAISDVKDEAEFDQIYLGDTYTPEKKNRLLLIPFTISLQYRLFRDDIVDNFRPYVNAGIGPTMIYVFPYTNDRLDVFGYPEKVEFFSSLKYGRPRYTLGGFLGAGVYFGMEKGSITGLSVKYFLARFPDGIEVMYGGYMKDFGGLFITLTFGSMF
jgi:hypothetical protein